MKVYKRSDGDDQLPQDIEEKMTEEEVTSIVRAMRGVIFKRNKLDSLLRPPPRNTMSMWSSPDDFIARAVVQVELANQAKLEEIAKERHLQLEQFGENIVELTKKGEAQKEAYEKRI